MAPGIVVEEMPEGSAGAKAGIQPGDILLSWRRPPNPVSDSKPDGRTFESPFDFQDLRFEEAPKGAVEVSGRRGDLEKTWKIEIGSWRGVEVGPHWKGKALELSLRGRRLIESGDLQEGVNAWGQLADRLGNLNEKRPRLWVLYRIAGQCLEAGQENPKAAEELAKILAELQSEPHLPLEASQVQQRLAYRYKISGALDPAHELYSNALETRQRLIPESLRVAESFNGLGSVAWNRRDLEKAAELHGRSLRIRERLAPDSLELAGSMNNLGIIAWDRGDLERAQRLHTGALEIRKKLAPGGFDEARSLNNLGGIAWKRGDLDLAQDLHLRSLKILERIAPESLELSRGLSNLGIVANSRGDLKRAHELQMRALKIKERVAPDSLDVAASLGNLGVITKGRGDLEGASEFFTRSLRVREQVAPGSLEVANSLGNLGVIAKEQGDLDRAQDLQTRALAIEEELAPGSLEVASTLNNLGAIALEKGEIDQAQRLLTRALRMKQRLAPGDLTTANSLYYLAKVMSAMGELNAASSYYSQALETLERQIKTLGGSYRTQAKFRAQQRILYQEAMTHHLARDRVADAFNVLERFRGRTFLTMLAERDIAFGLDLPKDLDRERRRLAVRHDETLNRLAKLSEAEAPEKVEALYRELEEIDRKRGEIEEEVRRSSPRLAALQNPEPLTSREARAVLDVGTLVVSFMVGEKSTVIFALSPKGALEVRRAPVGEELLREQVKVLTRRIAEMVPATPLGKARAHAFRAVSRELFDRLLGPFEDRIERSERLLLLLDGPLHALPFGALLHRSDEGEQYLAQWKRFHIALSLTAYAELKKDRPRAEKIERGSFQIAAFGDPSYGEDVTLSDSKEEDSADQDFASAQIAALRAVPELRGNDFKWPSLPYTRREVEGIAELFSRERARIFLGPSALEETVKNLDSEVDILHLATHASTNDRIPLNSYVALTIPEDLEEGRDNGLLQAWEILEQVRLEASLVVLSGCRTGTGQELRGEGLVGLTRAFQYAGARSVIASLWMIDDQSTAELMVRLYRHLGRGLDPDEALRAAQSELAKGPIEVVDVDGSTKRIDFSAPYFWAGFQLYGDWS